MRARQIVCAFEGVPLGRGNDALKLLLLRPATAAVGLTPSGMVATDPTEDDTALPFDTRLVRQVIDVFSYFVSFMFKSGGGGKGFQSKEQLYYEAVSAKD